MLKFQFDRLTFCYYFCLKRDLLRERESKGWLNVATGYLPEAKQLIIAASN